MKPIILLMVVLVDKHLDKTSVFYQGECGDNMTTNVTTVTMVSFSVAQN